MVRPIIGLLRKPNCGGMGGHELGAVEEFALARKIRKRKDGCRILKEAEKSIWGERTRGESR